MYAPQQEKTQPENRAETKMETQEQKKTEENKGGNKTIPEIEQEEKRGHVEKKDAGDEQGRRK